MKVHWHMPTLRRSACGLSIRAIRLAQGLRDAGHDVTFLVDAAKTDVSEPQIEGIPLRRLCVEKSRPLHWCLQAISRRKAARAVAPLIAADCGVVISCQPELVAACAILPNRPPVVFVSGSSTLLHDDANRSDQAHLPVVRRWFFAIDRVLKRQSEQRAFSAADLVILDSLQTRERLIADYGLSARHVHTVHGGVDAAAFHPPNDADRRAARVKLRLESDETVVVWTGRFSPEKNLGLLIEAIPCCRRHLTLLLVGEGEEEHRLRRLAKQRGLDDSVRFVGSQRDVRPYLHAADIFAFPSRSESFGGSLAEGLACGLPAVGLRPDGQVISNANREIIEHGGCGLLVDVPRPADFADALGRLATDRPLRVDLGAAGRRWVVENFTWSRAADQFSRLVAALPGRFDGGCVRPAGSATAEARRVTGTDSFWTEARSTSSNVELSED